MACDRSRGVQLGERPEGDAACGEDIGDVEDREPVDGDEINDAPG
jgi:hypothetical protein